MLRKLRNKYSWEFVCHPHASICNSVCNGICRLLQDTTKYSRLLQDTTKYLHAHASRAKVVQSIAVPRLEQHSPTKHIFASHIFNEADFCFKHLSECVSNNDNSSCTTEPTIFQVINFNHLKALYKQGSPFIVVHKEKVANFSFLNDDGDDNVCNDDDDDVPNGAAQKGLLQVRVLRDYFQHQVTRIIGVLLELW